MPAETLWDVLEARAQRREVANVRELAKTASDLLVLVRDTFPTYTMHDQRHAENVIALMGELARPGLDEMTGLEAALLILAAYLHDIGMVYTADELAEVEHEEEFQEFLRTHDEAYLRTHRNGMRPPPDVVENYCRFRHADRARVHLDRFDTRLLEWDGSPLTDALDLLCRSHNQSAATLKDDRFQTRFLGEADLRLCAVLLRLADLLDFDDSRTPPAIYDHLGLARRASARTAVSDTEWRRHLTARGFRFPDERTPGYPLLFIANPDHPGVEHDVRQFLDVVEEELLRCRALRDFCSRRWRELPLPGSVDRQQVSGRGYKYGEFRFELDRTATLSLFTGEQLYEDPYAFLRELLQNAMDAVRLRTFLHGDEHTNPAAVDITCWEDPGGYVWVRVDDNGIGMDEDAIHRYFLGVGRSYYRSPEFEADLLRQGRKPGEFGAISRFGIGVLSCFMAGDRVEVSTRHIRPDGTKAAALRLSLSRDEDYFVVQEQPMRPEPMPCRSAPADGYRIRPGTAIAVRVDPNRSDVEFAELAGRIESYLFAPPVPVTINGVPAGRGSTELVERPWLPAPVFVEVPRDQGLDQAISAIYGVDSLPYLGPCRVAVIPVSLVPVEEILPVRGQLLAHVPVIPGAATAAEDATGSPDLLAGWPQHCLDRVDPRVRELLGGAVTRTTTSVRWHRPRTGLHLKVTRRLARDRIDEAIHLLPFRAHSPALPRSTVDPLTRAATIAGDPAMLRAALTQITTRHHYSWTETATAFHLPAATLPWRATDVDGVVTRWGYTGVALPAIGRDMAGMLYPHRGSAFVLGAIDLSGRLRIDLSVSRDQVRAVPFQVHSALQLAIRRALRPLRGTPFGPAARILAEGDIFRVAPAEPCSMGTIAADPLFSGGAWDVEDVVPTPVGARPVAGLAPDTGRTGEIALTPPKWVPRWDRTPRTFHFHHNLARAVIATLPVLWHPDGEQRGRLLLTADPHQPIEAGARLFVPLFAVPYAGDPRLARSGLWMNLRHPLVRWLFQHAEVVQNDFPTVFRRTFARLNESVDPERVNAALDRVARARPDIAPPPEAYIIENADREWWSR